MKETSEHAKTNDGTDRIKSAKRRIKYPLVVKMIGIISIIVVVAMTTITSITSWFFSEESGALSLLDTIRENAGNRSIEQATVTNWFDRNASVAMIVVPGQKEIKDDKFFRANELEPDIGIMFETPVSRFVTLGGK